MRREPYGVGSIIHVVKRGARGLPFLKDDEDRDRFLLQMRHFNDASVSPHWLRDLIDENKHLSFERASIWEEQCPIVGVHAFCLHSNHIHLLLEEIVDGGVSRFMQKIGIGISKHLNEKYAEYGSPFQGSYKSKTIDTDAYLRYVIAYIEVKNTFEQFPRGYTYAAQHFDEAFEWALRFPFSSLRDRAGTSDVPDRNIVSGALIPTLWNQREFKTFARDVIAGRAHLGTADKGAFAGAFM